MNLFEGVAAPKFRPALNVGSLFDITTGQYELGKHGEMILNGGFASCTAIGAKPNNYKTMIAIHFMNAVRRNCHGSYGMAYDSEGTLPASRFNNQAVYDPYLRTLDFTDDPQFLLTDVSAYYGDEFWKIMRDSVARKSDSKHEKEFLRTTPFVDKAGEYKKAIYPTTSLIDSLSTFQTTGSNEKFAKNMVGDSGNNTEAMNQGSAKSQLLRQVPGITSKNGVYLIFTALLGDTINMEGRPINNKKLAHMKNDMGFKSVSPSFYSLPHNLWAIESNRPLLDKDKFPQYPRGTKKESIEGDTDLSIITIRLLRAKNGMSGYLIPMVVSQSTGMLPGLSEFHFCKTSDNFGISGNDRNYYLDLLPDVALSRTTVRGKLETSEELLRATSITADILQIGMFHREFAQNLICSPAELYEDLKAMGYDWSVLLNTRSYWVFVEDEDQHPQPFLSTADLLRMRKGEYIPYWFTKEQKAGIDLSKAK